MILVARAEKPIITISGSDGLARDEHNFTRGVKLFQGVQIISQTRKEAEELDDDVSLYSILKIKSIGFFAHLKWSLRY